MKIFDCTTYFNEPLIMDVRFNILDKYVDKFIIVESTYSHSGKKKEINFDINSYPKFKNKIQHIIIDKEPNNIINEVAFIQFEKLRGKKVTDNEGDLRDCFIIFDTISNPFV